MRRPNDEGVVTTPSVALESEKLVTSGILVSGDMGVTHSSLLSIVTALCENVEASSDHQDFSKDVGAYGCGSSLRNTALRPFQLWSLISFVGAGQDWSVRRLAGPSSKTTHFP